MRNIFLRVLFFYVFFVLIIIVANNYVTKNEITRETSLLKNKNILNELKKIDADLFSYSSKIYIINLWSASCIPCMKEIPELNKIYEKYNSENIDFLAISKYKKDSINFSKKNIVFKFNKYYKKVKLFDFLQNLNPQNKKVIPVTIIINDKGNVEYFFQGYSKSNIKIINNYLAKKYK